MKKSSKSAVVSHANSESFLKTFIANYALLAGILIITFIVYSNVFSFEFVNIDDNEKILENNLIRDFSTGGIAKIFGSLVFHSYLPLTVLSQAVEFHFFGQSPAAAHAINLLFHLLNIVLLYVFVRNFSGSAIAANVAAALFAVHPMNVETVCWASERSNLLFAFFYLSSLIFYVRHIGKFNLKYIFLSYMFYLAAVLSKSSAIPLALVFILIDWYKGRRFDARNITEKAVFLITAVAFGVVAIVAMSGPGGFRNIDETYNLLDRILFITYPLGMYLFKFILPAELNLFNPFPIKEGAWLPFVYYLVPMIIAFLVFAVSKMRSMKKEIILGLLFFITNISVLINIFSFGGDFIIAEHFVYVPYIGLFLIVGMFVHNVFSGTIVSLRKIKPYIIAGVLVVFTLFSVRSWSRAQVWSDSISFFADASVQNPENSLVWMGLGSAFQNKGKQIEALECYNKAVQFNKKSPAIYYNRSLVFIAQKQNDKAIEDLNLSIKADSTYFAAYNNRGNLRKISGDTSGAMSDFNTCLRLNPEYVAAYYNRGSLKLNMEDFKGAIADLDIAIMKNPKYIEAYNNRGIAKYFDEQYEASIIDYNIVLKLNPKHVVSYKNRGLSKLALGDKNAACADFRLAFYNGFSSASYLLEEHCGEPCRHGGNHTHSHSH